MINIIKGLFIDVKESFFGAKPKSSLTVSITIALMGILIALAIVFERFISIPVGDISRYSLTFVVLVLGCYSLGALKGCVVAALADFIGSMIRFGNCCPLLTLTLIVIYLFWGLIIYKKVNISRIVIGVLFEQIIGCLLLKTASLAIWYHGGISAFPKVFATRIVQVLLMIPFELVVLIILSKVLFPEIKKLSKEFGL